MVALIVINRISTPALGKKGKGKSSPSPFWLATPNAWVQGVMAPAWWYLRIRNCHTWISLLRKYVRLYYGTSAAKLQLKVTLDRAVNERPR